MCIRDRSRTGTISYSSTGKPIPAENNPVLEAMGKDVAEKTPRRFCALYTANGMSLPHAKHGIDEWSWFPRAEQDGEFVFGKSTEAFVPFRKQLSFMGGLYHPNGPKSDPHVCSDMWLTGAPLQDPKREVYNSVALDQVVAKHTKQFCRQPSLVMSVDAGVGFLSRTGTISYLSLIHISEPTRPY